MAYVLVYKIIDFIFQLTYLALLIRVLLSWIPHNHYNPVIQFIYRFTNPILKPFQGFIPTGAIGIDFSPILAFFALGILRQLIFRIL